MQTWWAYSVRIQNFIFFKFVGSLYNSMSEKDWSEYAIETHLYVCSGPWSSGPAPSTASSRLLPQ